MGSYRRVEPGERRVQVDLPVELAEWLQGFAELSHRSVAAVVRGLLEEERRRVEANWSPRR
ncbi:hypothetical protein [Kitasatospora cheerisanensis]|uniref:CopG-like ribbon-helix-helix domain-containing protein n=1 Tax=Kitasatospora cheerisanensis KCTC 2395 TaxID=1348663 RepID=A0A066YPX7_9ACTN|nr:hypothetical protein [Kitasatospora cheerisanensis]KDN82039.1 hypothetical protein KCH_61930 [Kitasatospora cheerisanensis KCTC 2395]